MQAVINQLCSREKYLHLGEIYSPQQNWRVDDIGLDQVMMSPDADHGPEK